MGKDKRAVVIGAGVAGLYAGLYLLERNVQVSILEKEPCVGGMARSVCTDGFTYDLGFHVLHTSSQHYKEFFSELLGSELREVVTTAVSYLDGQYHDFPPTVRGVLKLPAPVAAGVFLDLVRGLVRKRFGEPKESFEEQLKLLAGDYLYRKYFHYYTLKFWGISPLSLSSKWVPKRVLPRLWGRSAQGTEWQAYPTRGGIGLLPGRMAERFRNEGGQILLGAEVVRFDLTRERAPGVVFRQDGSEEIAEPDLLIATMPLLETLGLLGLAGNHGLHYRSQVYLLLKVRSPRVLGEPSMIFFPSPNLPFTRAFDVQQYGLGSAPDGCSAVEIELPCQYQDDLWCMEDEEIAGRVLEALHECGLLGAGVEGYTVVRQKYAYPIHSLEYYQHIEQAREEAVDRGIHLAGRMGTFQYLDMCGAMETGRKAAELALSLSPQRGFAAGARSGR